ncbi:MAG: DUF309 domain-containing protein [Campylobacterota bacterium]|nr:DUF309 domain-containing protein [Campylobacterota bacterium]
MINRQLNGFIKCLDERRYYDAHEALEAIWFPRRFEESDEMKLLKGFINAAVSFELYKRGREKQAQRVWKNYLKYRELLYKIDSPHLHRYHHIAKHLENLNINIKDNI